MYAHNVLRIKPYDHKADAKTREPIHLTSYESAQASAALLGTTTILLGEPLTEHASIDRRAFTLPLGAPGHPHL